MTTRPLITVITPTTGKACVLQAIESVESQSYNNIQHLVFIDNPNISPQLKADIRKHRIDVIEMPYPTGKDRFNGHRIYGASVFLANGDYFCYLDEDNWYDPDHVECLLGVVKRGYSWAFSFRKIIEGENNFVCYDDCESLGKWPSVLGETDYLVDVNCYFFPRSIALWTCPIWYRRFRDSNMMEVDRALVTFLRTQKVTYETSGRYSVNYRTGNTRLSVRKEFFLQGNEKMNKKYNGSLPWKTGGSTAPAG